MRRLLPPNVLMLFSLLVLCSIALPAHAQGVMLPPGEEVYAERAVAVGQDGTSVELTAPDRVFSSFVAGQLPPSDRAQFWLVVYADRTSPESRLLLQDFERHEGLRVIRDWAKFVVIDRSESPAAEARHLVQRLSGADVPTLLLFAHPEHPVFGEQGRTGWRYAFQRAGYGGDAALLARNLYQSIQQLYSEAGVPTEQCPGPYCPQPNQPNQPNHPWQPTGPYDPNGWNTPPLPRLDEQTGLVDRLVSWVGWVVVIIGVLAAVFWIGKKLGSLSASAVFLALFLGVAPCLAGPDAAADQAKPPDAPPAVAVEGEAELAETYPGAGVLYPPIPTQWEWLRAVIREEIRQGIDPPAIESFLSNALAHLELNVQSEIVGIRRSADTIHQASLAAVGLLAVGLAVNAVTLAAAARCLAELRQLRTANRRRR